MKKKALIIGCSVLVVVSLICLFTALFQWYFVPSRGWSYSYKEITKKHIEHLEDNNAAKYYLRACLLVQDDVYLTDSMFERFDNVLRGGWNEDDPDLERYLNRYEPALDLVREGVKSDICSMPTDDPFFGSSYLGGCRQIARLLLARARLAEWKGELAKAAQTYSDLLRFSADVADNGMLVHTWTGAAAEGLAYEGVVPYLARIDEKSICRQLLADLVDIEQGRASFHDVLESEYTKGRHLFGDYGKEILYTNNLPDDPGVTDYFIDTVERLTRYIGFKFAQSDLMAQRDEFNRAMLEISTMTYPEILNEPLEDKFVKDEMSEQWLEMYPTYVFLFARQETIRRANIIRAALHLRILENGEYPESLKELEEIVSEEVLIDPFSEKPFVYKKTEDAYLLYSLGGDMDDDGGTPDQPPWNLGDDGDIVFKPPGSSAAESQAQEEEST
jgi:hypothetical protein